jgi:hypothetical protein
VLKDQVFGRQRQHYWDWFVGMVILGSLTTMFYLSLHHHLLNTILIDTEAHRWSRLVLRPSMMWTWFGVMLLVFRTVLWIGRLRSAAAIRCAPCSSPKSHARRLGRFSSGDHSAGVLLGAAVTHPNHRT